MNRTAPSINAVLANERYHAARERIAESPISPTSPAPSFSWPRRVRSPEPHVPLRKASPERLHQRAKKPPLFVTTNHGAQALGPATTSSVASPHHTSLNMAKNAWWPGAEDETAEAPQRKPSSPADHTWAVRQRQLSAVDASAKSSWPLGERSHSLADRNAFYSIPEATPDDMRTSYRSGLTSASSHMDSTIATARSSIMTADSSVSDCVKIDSSWADEQDEAEEEEEDDDDGGGFTVDDALDMYLGGFGTPSRLSVDMRNSLDVRGSVYSRRGSYPHGSLDQSLLKPGTSPLGNGGGDYFSQQHRRSHSTSLVDRKSVLLEVNPENNNNIKPTSPLALEVKTHARNSTEILSGQDLAQVHLPQDSPQIHIPQHLPQIQIPQPPINVPRDRYGFKKLSHHITVQQYDEWEKPYNEHLDRRRAKWNALMKQFGYATENPNRFPTKSEKVKRYVRKGIPPDWRGAAWFWYAGGPGKLAKDPGLYWNLLHRVNQGDLTDNDREHIERDLNRTFPDNIRFKPDPASGPATDVETPMIKALRRLLQAFAVHNPNIGYCQSLNFIAGLLLLFLDEDEEKAFVLLNVVTTQHLPGTHGVALEGANIDIGVLMASIKESLPGIWAKLDDKPTTPGPNGAPRLPTVSLATTAWFMSLFVGTLPIECVLRVWDCLFLEGSKTLFRVALAIFKSGEQQIKAVNDPMEIFQVVQTMPRGMLDANTLMETCFRKRGGFGGLSQDVVERRREEGRNATRQGRSMTEDIGKKSLIRGKSRFRSKAKSTLA